MSCYPGPISWVYTGHRTSVVVMAIIEPRPAVLSLVSPLLIARLLYSSTSTFSKFSFKVSKF